MSEDAGEPVDTGPGHVADVGPEPEGSDEIAAAVERVNAVRPQLEDLRRDIVEAAADWVVTWWDVQVRGAIEADPWRVLDELGPDGVGDLKARVEQLKASAPEIVRERLSRSTLWVHRAGIDELIQLARAGLEAFERPYYLSGRGVQRVEEELRRIAGELGPLLVTSGLGRFHLGGDPAGGAWRRPTEGGARYMKEIEWSHDLVRTMEVYAHHVSTLFIAVRELDDLRRAHATNQAVRLWDEA